MSSPVVSALMRRDLTPDMFDDLFTVVPPFLPPLIVDVQFADGLTVLTFARDLTDVEAVAVLGRMTSPVLVAHLAELRDPEADPDLQAALTDVLAYILGEAT